MKNDYEEIKIEISSELLDKVSVIAEKLGLTAEEYISRVVDQYVERNMRLIRQGEMAKLFANVAPEAEAESNR